MNKELSSTKWGRCFVDEALARRCREAWLDTAGLTQPKIAKNISKTTYPDGKTHYYEKLPDVQESL